MIQTEPSRKTRQAFVVAWSIVMVLHCVPMAVAAGPNIIILLTDDMGYQDLSCQGSQDLVTKHIDSLALQGVRCTSGYVTSCMCSPSRAGLLTGRSQSRFGHEVNWEGPAAPNQGLPVGERTIADLLSSAGYQTGIVGKWHLGENTQFHPLNRGFDEFFGFLGGGHRYFCDLYRARSETRRVSEYDTLLESNRQPIETSGYLTDVLADQAVDFIHRHRQSPFFLYVSFNAPHAPVQAPAEDLEQFSHIDDVTRRTYSAMMKRVDEGVGKILDQVRRDRLEENCLIYFLSDNGGPLERNGSTNAPLAGEKGGMWEGGIRVPFLVQWKGHLPAGKLYDRPVSSLDILPTALAAAGLDPPIDRPLDGVNLLPYFTGSVQGDPHAALYWRMKLRKIWAVRSGDLKLVRQPAWPNKHIGGIQPRLIDLSVDVAEENDLVMDRADDAQRLSELFGQWSSTLPEPLWEISAAKAESSPKAEAAPE